MSKALIYNVSEQTLFPLQFGAPDIISARVPIDVNVSTAFSASISKQGADNDNITVVTAFFDIGVFQKGSSPKTKFSPMLYFQWARIFKYLVNPLVVYTDSKEFQRQMRILRSRFSKRTKLFLINRNSSWAFQKREEISRIYTTKGYPKHFPNTVIPDYACAQHAKYDLVSKAANQNYFRSKYFLWLDIGYFRDIQLNRTYFTLQTPQNFNISRIAMNRVNNVSLNISYSKIFMQNRVWVGGGLFFGTAEAVFKYEQQYNTAVNYFISKRLMNTDQQINYAMFSVPGRKAIKPNIEIQLYSSNKSGDWFYLGYMMRSAVPYIQVKKLLLE